MRENLGSWVNPPIGHSPTEITTTENYIAQMVLNLASHDLKSRNIRWTVYLFQDKDPNAFVMKVLYPDEAPFRGFNGDSPISETGSSREIHVIGVTTGLLNLYRNSEARLAFVMGHELAHLFEGHAQTVDPNKNRRLPNAEELKHWWGGQKDEAVADIKGVDRIAGKYPLDEAIEGLNDLLKAGPGKESEFESAESSHHHEGVRIATVQAYVEAKERSLHGAPSPQNRALPKDLFFKLGVKTERRSEKAETFKPRLVRFVRDRLSKPGVLEGILTGESRTYRTLLLRYPNDATSEQRSELLIELTRTINRKRLDPSQKMDLWMRVAGLFGIHLNGHGPPNDDFLKSMTDAQMHELSEFLVQNSKQWSFERFQAGIRKDFADQTNFDQFNYYLVNFFVQHLTQQKLLNRLCQVNPAVWESFRRAIPLIYNTDNGAFSLSGLGHYAWELSREEFFFEGPLKAHLKQDILDFIRSNLNTSWATKVVTGQSDRGKLEYLGLRDIINSALNPGKTEQRTSKRVKLDLEFLTAISDSLRVLDDAFTEFRDRRILTILEEFRKGEIDITFLGNFFRSTLESTAFRPFSEHARPKIENALREIVVFTATQTPLDINLTETSSIYQFLLKIILDPNSAPLEKDSAARLMFSITESEHLRLPEYGLEEYIRLVEAVFSNVPIEMLIRWTNVRMPSIEKAVIEFVARHYDGFKIRPDFFEADLMTLIDNHKLKTKKEIGFDAMTLLEDYKSVSLQSRVSWLTLLGLIPDRWNEIIPRIQIPELRAILDGIESAKCEHRLILNLTNPSRHYKNQDIVEEWDVSPADAEFMDMGLEYLAKLSAGSTEFLFRSLIHRLPEMNNLEEWFEIFTRIHTHNRMVLHSNPDLKDGFRSFLWKRLARLPVKKASLWLEKKETRAILSSRQLATLILRGVRLDPAFLQGDREKFAERVKEYLNKLNLKGDHADAYQIFRNEFSQIFNIQPNEKDLFFEPDHRTLSEKAEGFSTTVRGLSAIVAMARQENKERQLELIEYLLGQKNDIPEFVRQKSRSKDNLDSEVRYDDLVTAARGKLSAESQLTRAFVTNMFLAGPHSFLSTPDGEGWLLSELLKNVSVENRPMADLIARAVLHSFENRRSLGFSFVLANSVTETDSTPQMREAKILNCLFNAFGVPGIKFAQYLAFTSRLKDYQSVLDLTQDHALPLSYFEMLELIETRFGEDWPSAYKILGLKGSGSVNVAIEYIDLRTGEHAIANIKRENIEGSSAVDFGRFKEAISFVLRDPRFGAELEYMAGLTDVIQESIRLEFDKERVYEMQRRAEDSYHFRASNGWSVETVRAIDVRNQTLFMTLAPGKSAREVKDGNPAAYREALRAFSEIEWDLMTGSSRAEPTQPAPALANPDFHDGQILIDTENRRVTVIDMGQAVVISNQDREFAISILGLLSSGGHEGGKSAKILNRAVGVRGSIVVFSDSEIGTALGAETRIDKFVRLIHLFEKKGEKLPISVVHWILGVNRFVEIDKKTGGRTNELRVASLVLGEGFGVNLRTFNILRAPIKEIQRKINPPTPTFGGGRCAEFLRSITVE